MRKVTGAEIKKLHEFTQKHYVEYYDVEIELVDHLANAIEELWAENPGSSFEENMQVAFKRFGIFGFMDVVEKGQSSMTKKYYKLIWSESLKALKRPKVLFFVLLFGFLYRLVLKMPEGFVVLNALFLLQFLALFILMLKQFSFYRKRKKRYLLEQIIMSAGGGVFIVMLPQFFIQNLLERGHIVNIYVVQHAEKANTQIGTFGFCRHTIPTQKTRRSYFFAHARAD